MALTVFLAGVTSTVESFIADATVEVTQNFTNEVASHPVGRGTITDNVYKKNPTINIKGVVTNHPVTTYDSNLIGYEEGRAINADKLLRELWDEGSIFTILTEYNDFNYCVLQSYSATFTSESSEALEFNITAVVVRPVSSEVVTGLYADILEADASKTNNGSGQVKEETGLRLVPALNHMKDSEIIGRADILRSLGVIDDEEFAKIEDNL